MTATMPEVTAESAFRLSGDELRELAEAGSTVAADEIQRRARNRAAKGKRPLRPATGRVRAARRPRGIGRGEYEARQQHAYEAGVQLGRAHAAGSVPSVLADAEYESACAGQDEEMFGLGYADGIVGGAVA